MTTHLWKRGKKRRIRGQWRLWLGRARGLRILALFWALGVCETPLELQRARSKRIVASHPPDLARSAYVLANFQFISW